MALATAHRAAQQSFSRVLARALPDEDLTRIRDVSITGIACDSRAVVPGHCFVATTGTQTDGHDYIAEAVAAGASAVVAEHAVTVPSDVPLVVAPNSRRALARMAAVFYGLDTAQRDNGLRVIGVTGTNGKSTVCHLLRTILKTSGSPCALVGTVEIDLIDRVFEASLTTPPAIELARHLAEAASCSAKWAVIEASSHALDQHRCDGVRFDVGVFTNLTGDHRDYHPTVSHYRDSKKRLFDALADEAAAVINVDDPAGPSLLGDCKARPWGFGFGSDADIRAETYHCDEQGSRVRLRTPSGVRELSLPLIGRYNIANGLAAVAAALAVGVELDTVVEGLANATPVPGRLERIVTEDSAPTVLVDYAHTDDALRNVLEAVRPITRRRLIVVFGCGGDRDTTKRPRMGRIAAELADEVVVTHDNPRTESPQRILNDILSGVAPTHRSRVLVEPDRRIAIDLAIDHGRVGDVVLIAGKGHETYQIIGTERRPFDDRLVAADALDRREAGERAAVG